MAIVRPLLGELELTETSTWSEETLMVTEGTERALDAELRRAQDRAASLLVVRGEGEGTLYELGEEAVSIGRHPSNTIRLDSSSVSRHHAVVEQLGEGDYLLRDLGSRNGSYVNERRVEGEMSLSKGDLVRLGSTVLKYIPAGELELIYQERMIQAAHVDALTRVYNSNYMRQLLDQAFHRAHELGEALSLLILDVDDFKAVNDTLGHDAGDDVLFQIADVARAIASNAGVTLGRYGGEEFIVLLPGASEQRAMQVGERMRSAIDEHPFCYQQEHLHITVSLGLSSYDPSHESPGDLYREADQALYASKRDGKNQLTVYRAR